MVAIFVNKILILGSGPNVIDILEQDLSGYDKIVVINNAWKVIEGWTDHIFPHDFPNQNKPQVLKSCLLYTSPSPRDATLSRMPSSA